MSAEGLIAFDELRVKLADLEETRETAERDLATLKGQRESIEQMERYKDAVLEQYAALAPKALEALTPEQRHGLYKMLRLVVLHPDGSLDADWEWEIPNSSSVCRTKTTETRSSRSHPRETTSTWTATLRART